MGYRVPGKAFVATGMGAEDDRFALEIGG